MECMKRFCHAVVEIYEEEYMRTPNQNDINRLMKIGEERGFPGIFGSIGCMHWTWKNCPTAWNGQYAGKEKVTTLILKAVASQDLWIWHWFFGLPGSLNDTNVLDRSHVFSPLASSNAPEVGFFVDGNRYVKGYYLADGVYPNISTFVKKISEPQFQKKKNFPKTQEEARKDVERAFGMLQAHFAIIRNPARLWDVVDLTVVMKSCIIMHNMIVEDERDQDLSSNHDVYYDNAPRVSGEMNDAEVFASFVERFSDIRNDPTHHDLIEHLWNKQEEI